MTALVGGPPPTEPGPRHAQDDLAPVLPTRPAAEDRTLNARDNEAVYQAARDLYVVRPTVTTHAPAKIIDTLPRDTPAFTDRSEELAILVSTVTEAAHAGRMIPICAIDGMPGVGKTALAVHAGHLLAAHFPHGRLFLELRAHATDQKPVDPADALAALLSTDGMHHKEIPPGLDQRAALWRARMADKRVLLILDDAAGYKQVEPLLPGAAGCLVMITSRHRLRGLRARHAAEPISLRTLPPDQAVTLFTGLSGRRLVGEETRGATELVKLCGYLPLAIALVAAKFGPELSWRVTDLVDEITASQDRLAHMRAEDLAVTAAFDLSYRDLPDDLRRFFRRLSLHPGTDVDVYAAAALDGTSIGEARRNLDVLYERHLIEQPLPGRFRMHDLLGDYARLLAANDPPDEREDAIYRILDYYEHTATLANHHLARRPRTATVPLVLPVPPLTSYEQAIRWTNIERANLLACAAYARSRGLAHRVIRLSAALAACMYRTGPWHQAITLHREAASAAEHLGDRVAQAEALFEMGVLLRHTGEYGEAKPVLQRALVVYSELGERLREADVLDEIGSVHRMTGDFHRARKVLQRALETYRRLDDPRGLARSLNTFAVVQYLTDDFPGAIKALHESLSIHDYIDDPPERANALFLLGSVRLWMDDYSGATRALSEALTAYREIHDRLGEANVHKYLGVVCRMTGDHLEAKHQLTEAMVHYVHLGDRLGQANALKHLGVLHRLAGDYSAARDALRQALVLYGDLNHRVGRADALASMGIVQQLAGDAEAAAESLASALEMYKRINSRRGQAEVLNALGALLLERNDVPQALLHHESALNLAAHAHSALEKARASEGLAYCMLRQQRDAEAIGYLQASVEIYRRIEVPEAARAAAKLASIETSNDHR